MAFENYQIMSVALVVAEEKILAVCRVNLLPILKSEFDGWKGRVMVCVERDSMIP